MRCSHLVTKVTMTDRDEQVNWDTGTVGFLLSPPNEEEMATVLLSLRQRGHPSNTNVVGCNFTQKAQSKFLVKPVRSCVQLLHSCILKRKSWAILSILFLKIRVALTVGPPLMQLTTK